MNLHTPRRAKLRRTNPWPVWITTGVVVLGIAAFASWLADRGTVQDVPQIAAKRPLPVAAPRPETESEPPRILSYYRESRPEPQRIVERPPASDPKRPMEASPYASLLQDADKRLEREKQLAAQSRSALIASSAPTKSTDYCAFLKSEREWIQGIQRQGCRERGYRYSYGGYAHRYPNCESLRAGDRRNWQEQCRHGCIHC